MVLLLVLRGVLSARPCRPSLTGRRIAIPFAPRRLPNKLLQPAFVPSLLIGSSVPPTVHKLAKLVAVQLPVVLRTNRLGRTVKHVAQARVVRARRRRRLTLRVRAVVVGGRGGPVWRSRVGWWRGHELQQASERGIRAARWKSEESDTFVREEEEVGRIRSPLLRACLLALQASLHIEKEV